METNNTVRTLTDEQVKAAAIIFAACWNATGGRNLTDVENAQRFPLKMVQLYIKKMNDMHASTPEIERLIAEQFEKFDVEAVQDCFDTCLSMQQQGVWSLAYDRARAAK